MRWSWLALLLLFGCGGDDVAPPMQEAEPNPLHEELQRELDRFDAGSPGVIIAVSAPDFDTFYGAAGWSNLSEEVAMKPDELFGIASLTKSFTAAVVLQLRDEGLLALDDTLSTHCPACGFGDKTIEQLLRHRSGISDVVRPLLESGDLSEIGRAWTLEELLALATDTGAAGFRYSNTNYLLLGAVIEAVTGSSWEAEVRARLLNPLALEHTYLPTVEEVPSAARGYFDYEGLLIDATELVHPSIGWSAGSMVSSSADMITWMRELSSGDTISATVRAAMTESDGSYGRGLYVLDSALGPDTKVGHDGLSQYTSEAFCIPDAAACVVAMANQYDVDAKGVATLAWQMILR